MLKRTPPPLVPVCLLSKWTFGIGTPRVIRVPEERAPWFLSHGWRMVARDSDVPMTLGPGQYYAVTRTTVVFQPPETFSEDNGA